MWLTESSASVKLPWSALKFLMRGGCCLKDLAGLGDGQECVVGVSLGSVKTDPMLRI